MISILLVDDEVQFLEVTRMFLEKGRGIRVTTATSADEALEILQSQRFDAIISDYAMPGLNGIEFMKRVKAMGDDTPFIIFTGKGREDVVIDALNFGADLYLEKSPDPRTQFSEMLQKVRNIVSSRADLQHEREQVQIYHTAMKGLPGIVFRLRITDGEDLLFASPGAELLTGFTADELVKEKGKFSLLISSHDRRRVQDARRSALQEGGKYEVDYSLLTRDGTNKQVREAGCVVTRGNMLVIEGYILDLDSLCKEPTIR